MQNYPNNYHEKINGGEAAGFLFFLALQFFKHEINGNCS
jgi:hypothetical protein